MINSRILSLAAVPACLLSTAWGVAPEAPEKALKYHEALLKRPHNPALFDRFFGAWVDEQPVEALGAFLQARAEANGGQEWTVLASYELRRGSEEAALAALGRAIEAVPGDPALLMERGRLRLRRLEFQEARQDLSRVAAGQDEVLSLEASKLTGKSWLREGRTDEAIKAWDAVLAAHPGDEDLLEDLVETAAAESETAQALVYAGKLIEASRDPYQKTLRMLRRGDLLVQSGKSDEAVETYAATLALVGEGSWLEREVLAQIEKLYRKQDRLDDLSTQLKKLAEANPRRLLIHRQLAKLEAAQGDTDAAIGRFREVLKRSPGERELREEFVRLLSDGERFDDAAAELDKLIELAPAEPDLLLQLAALRFRQGKPDGVLAALEKARGLMATDESGGIRIASLMLQYNLAGPGEALLKDLAARQGAGPTALETLAGHYGRTNRKPEAVELLKKAGAGDDVDILLRTTGSISALGETVVAYETLLGRQEKHSSDPRFLAALAQSALAAGKAADAVPQALRLVRLAKQTGELTEGISLASRVIAAAGKSEDVRAALSSQAARTASETCLLASLIESGGDFGEVAGLLDPNTDPMVVHFHAALLDRRGDFDTAIVVLSRLADTEEGRKAGYFKDLSELQQRAGKTQEALATVERWKQTAPGDKAAWVAGSRLLRQSGKPEEAVKMTRQAVSRFEGDADLSASLASLHDEAGQWADAEAIYWRLYDEAQSPSDQARWAVMLAQLSQRTGKTAELEEKFRERAKGNRRSIGPVLAQAELARVTNNDDKRRDLLLEAVRLQPKDLDLRLQIAGLEEQAGNPERVLAVLEEALPHDSNGRVRSALAQAYLRQGQAVKGMRELRLLAGKGGFDPRSAESAAASLAGSKLYDEAISLLRSELPDGGDWRSRYLLAVLLEEDGRETESLPLFLGLLQAEGEIPSLATPPARGPGQFDQFPKEVRAVHELVEAVQSAYGHRSNSGYGRVRYTGGGVPQTGPFTLPDKPEAVRRYALVHLCCLLKRKAGETDESLGSQLKAAGIDQAGFVSDLVKALQSGERQNLAKLLEDHSDQPGLFEWFMSYGGYGGSGVLDEKITRRVLEHPEKLSAIGRYLAWSSLTLKAGPGDPVWASMIEAARACAEDKSVAVLQGVLWRLMSQMQQLPEDGGIPEVHKPETRKLLLAVYERLLKEDPNGFARNYALVVQKLAGTPETWLAQLNATIREWRKKPSGNLGSGRSRSRLGQVLQYASMSPSRLGGYNPWGSSGELFELPTLQALPLSSIPQEVLDSFNEGDGSRNSVKAPVTIADLLKTPDKIESPLLRAWLAARSGNKDLLAKALAGDAPAREEALDFELLRAVSLTDGKKLPQAFASLLKARNSAGADRELSGWINVSLIALAGAMSPGEREAVAADLQATFLLVRPLFGQQGALVLAAQARKLGLEELAKRIGPAGASGQKGGGSATGPAALAGASMRGSPSSSSGSPDKIQKFIGEKKFEAAAREVLQMYRSQAAGSNSYYYLRSQFPQMLAMLGKDGQAELLKLVEPGDSRSLVKRLEFVDIARAMDKADVTVPVLEALLKERPDDAEISGRLVFLLPDSEGERRLAMMNPACRSDSFLNQANLMAEKFDDVADTGKAMAFFETVTRWLETAAEKSLDDVNLTWVSYHAKQFLEGDYTQNLPSVLSQAEEPKEEKETHERFRSLCERLARAMIRHASCSEEGFRLLNSMRRKTAQTVDMDEMARRSLLAAAAPLRNAYLASAGGRGFFSLIYQGGSSSSGSDLSEASSASWLVNRFKEVKSPSEILTPGFIAELKALNPEAGSLLETFSRELKAEDLPGLWKSELMSSRDDRLSYMLRPVLIKRLSTAPGAVRFFIEQISALPPGSAVPMNGSDRGSRLPMFSAALASCSPDKPEETYSVLKAISRAVFGEKIDFSDPKSQQQNYYRVNFLSSLGQQLGSDPQAVVRFHSACMRLGVPADDDEYAAVSPFQNKRFNKYEEFESFAESLGWLSEVDRWEPYACLTYRTSNGVLGGVQVTLQPLLLHDRVFQYMSLNLERGELVKKLKERKKGRFGALMTAAAISSGRERSQLAGQAFTEALALLPKLSAERVESLSLVLPWLPDDVRAKLPESFRRKVQAAESRKREEALALAEEFIASLKSPNNLRFMENVSAVVLRLIPWDPDKAVEVFVKADEEYTASLGRGGRFSSYSNNGMEISERDEAFGRIMRSDSSEVGGFNPKLRLRFLTRILASPSGARLLYLDTNYSDRSIFSRTASLLLDEDNRSDGDAERTLRMIEALGAAEAELKPMVFNCLMLADFQGGSGPRDKELLEKARALAGNDPLAQALLGHRLALSQWSGITRPEERAGLRKLFAATLSQGSIPECVRIMIAAQAITRIPRDGLLDETTMPALVKLYQEFCAGDRSAVAPVTLQLFDSLTRFPLASEAAVPMYAELSTAFWDNTSVAKPSGHPPIPTQLAQSAFIVTLLGKDSAGAAKVFPRIKIGLAGRLMPMLALMRMGQADLAKQLSPAAMEPFVADLPVLQYGRETEDSIAALRKAGADPMTVLKLEIELLAMPPATEAEAAAEPYPLRLSRLVDAFVAAPPPEPAFTLSLRNLVSRSNEVKLRPLAGKWLDGNPVSAVLVRQDRSSGINASRLRQASISLHGIMAARALAAGDPSRVEALRKEIEQKTGRDYETYQVLIGLMREINLTIWQDICGGNTSGYKSGLTAWNELVLQYSKQISNYDSSETRNAVSTSLLLSCLTDRQEAFGQMLDKLPDKARPYLKGYNRDGGFFNFIEALRYRGSLENLPETAGKRVFLEKVLSHPGFARSLTTQVGWVNRMVDQYGFGKEIGRISVDPPAGLIPESLPALYEYGGRLAYKTDPAKGLALTRKGLDSCPEGEAWNGSRGMLKWQTADQLLASGRPDEAKEVFVTIRPEEVAGWLRDRYNRTAKALGITPPAPDAPKKDAPAPPKS